jgi:hypothetical protein
MPILSDHGMQMDGFGDQHRNCRGRGFIGLYKRFSQPFAGIQYMSQLPSADAD